MRAMTTTGKEKLIEYLHANPAKGMMPADLRAWFAELIAVTPAPPEARLERASCEVPAYWITPPDAAPGRVIFYLHGGAYILGSAETHRETIYRFAKAASARALAVDYRLAPENPWPACREDAVAAYRWLLAQGVSPSQVAIAGDSAGGGLTVSTLLALRDLGEPLPGCAAVFSPWVDFTGSGDSSTNFTGVDPMVDPRGMIMMVAMILAGADPHASSPLFADLSRLPPIFVQVGTGEVLLDDARRLVERVKAAGGDAVLDAWEDMIHGFQAFPTFLPEAVEAAERAGAFVRTRLG
jgi:epsilon-lactone hydrolase